MTRPEWERVKWLAFDHGGVLTTPMLPALRQAAQDAQVDIAVVIECLSTDAAEGDSPLHRLERGQATNTECVQWVDAHYPGASRVLDYRSATFVGRYLQVHPAVEPTLRRLRAAGKLLAVASNSPTEWLTTTPLPPIELFDARIYSCQVGARKPERQFYEALLDRLRATPEEVLLVDDTANMVAAAEHYGMAGLHLTDHADLERLGVTLKP